MMNRYFVQVFTLSNAKKAEELFDFYNIEFVKKGVAMYTICADEETYNRLATRQWMNFFKLA